ncbi:MAG: helix-turn-helix domain-containing protein [bacterium]|nr:helix-turn-helix domain-containing protein [bacterium]
MRRTKKEIKKLRIKIIKLREEGKSYEEIRRRTGASPNTISDILQRFTGKYCVNCGETNSNVLHEHHPDKENRPDYTITLCANCHNEIHRSKKAKAPIKHTETNIQKQDNQVFKENKSIPVIPPEVMESVEIKQVQTNPTINLQPMEWEEIKNTFIITGGIVSIIEGLSNNKIKLPERISLLATGIFLFIKGIKDNQP